MFVKANADDVLACRIKANPARIRLKLVPGDELLMYLLITIKYRHTITGDVMRTARERRFRCYKETSMCAVKLGIELVFKFSKNSLEKKLRNFKPHNNSRDILACLDLVETLGWLFLIAKNTYF